MSDQSNQPSKGILGKLSPDTAFAFAGNGDGGGSLAISAKLTDRDQLDALLEALTIMRGWLASPRDSDRSPEGGDGTAPSRSDDSAGPKDIAQPPAGEP